MPFKTSILFVILLMTACQRDEQSLDHIRFQGLDINEVSLDSPFQLSSILYSSGKTNFLLTGDITVDGNAQSFSVMMNKDPRLGEFNILMYNAPKCCKELEEFIITYNNGVCEITWRSSSKYLNLKNGISELH